MQPRNSNPKTQLSIEPKRQLSIDPQTQSPIHFPDVLRQISRWMLPRDVVLFSTRLCKVYRTIFDKNHSFMNNEWERRVKAHFPSQCQEFRSLEGTWADKFKIMYVSLAWSKEAKFVRSQLITDGYRYLPSPYLRVICNPSIPLMQSFPLIQKARAFVSIFNSRCYTSRDSEDLSLLDYAQQHASQLFLDEVATCADAAYQQYHNADKSRLFWLVSTNQSLERIAEFAQRHHFNELRVEISRHSHGQPYYSVLNMVARLGRIDVMTLLFRTIPTLREELLQEAVQTNRALLFNAAECGQYDMVEYLLKQGFNPDRHVNGYRPLHAAIGRENLRLIQLLIRHRTALQHADDFKSVLELSIAVNRADFVELFLSLDPTLLTHRQRANASQALHLAVADGNLAMIKLFLKKGAPVNETATLPHLRRNKIVSGNLITTNIRSHEFTTTPLHLAILHGHKEIAIELINHGALLTHGNREIQPVHAAIEADSVEILEVLLGRDKTIIEARDGTNQTPLIRAIKKGNAPLAICLFSQGATFNVFEILDLALTHYERDIFFHLLSNGAKVNVVDNNDAHLLLRAVDDNRIFPRLFEAYVAEVTPEEIFILLRHLLLNNSDRKYIKLASAIVDRFPNFLHAANEQGETLLHLCAKTGSKQGVIYLLSKGLNIITNRPAKDGQPVKETVVDVALQHRQIELTIYLLASHFVPQVSTLNTLIDTNQQEMLFRALNYQHELRNSQNAAGQSLLTYACLKGKLSIIMELFRQEEQSGYKVRIDNNLIATINQHIQDPEVYSNIIYLLLRYNFDITHPDLYQQILPQRLNAEVTKQKMLCDYIAKRKADNRTHYHSFTLFGKKWEFGGIDKETKLYLANEARKVTFGITPFGWLRPDDARQLEQGELGRIWRGISLG